MSWQREIADAVAAQLAAQWPVWGMGTAAVLLLATLGANLPLRWGRALSGLSLLGALGAGLVFAWRVKWLCDDAFISFTYARNFAEGHGFVLNPGDYTEGYTNFLWVLGLGLLGKAQVSIPHAALFGNLACHVGLVVCAAVLAARASTRGFAALPVAAMAVALGRPFFTFATSGLETVVALFLCALAVVQWRSNRFVLAGVLFGLGAVTRPDHLLLAGSAWAVELLLGWQEGRSPRDTLRAALRLAAPTLALFTGWWLWRWAYYGDFFPNTFHAKSGGGSYFSQGLVYLWHGLLASGVGLLVVPLVALAVALRKDAQRRALLLYALVVAATHGLYVTRVGGDFMEFRFLLPTFFFTIVAVDAATRDAVAQWLAKPSWRLLAVPAWAAAFALLAVQVRPIGPYEKKWHLAAEETFYPVKTAFPLVVDTGLARLGATLHENLTAVGVTPKMAVGCIGMVGFFGRLPLMDAYGLANKRVAKHPIVSRGRPGHEKFATIEDMLAEDAVFSDAVAWRLHGPETTITVGGVTLWLIRHDVALEALARKNGWVYPNIDANLTLALEAPSKPELEETRHFYGEFLKGTPGAAERLARIDAALKGDFLQGLDAAALPASDVAKRLRQAESFGVTSLATALRSRVAVRYDFEGEVAEATVTGDIWPPAEGTLPAQTPVSGFQGKRLVNTYRAADASQGRIELPLPAGPSLRLDVLVGGGADCARTFVAVFDGAKELWRVCGKNDEVLRAVGVALPAADAPRLILADESSGGWGHLLVDDVIAVVTSPPPPPVAP